jgi:hypothetical protein
MEHQFNVHISPRIMVEKESRQNQWQAQAKGNEKVEAHRCCVSFR